MGHRRTIQAAVLGALALAAALPLVWMAVSSLLTSEALQTFPPSLHAGGGTLQNYVHLLQQADMVRWLWNTALVCGAVAGGQMVLCSLAGYAFSRGTFRGRRVWFGLVIGTMMVPGQILLVPLYALVLEFRLLDSLWAVILPALASPFGIYLVHQYLVSLPQALEDAARLDGCGVWGVFRHVALPLAAPAVAIVGLFAFLAQWNAFLWPLMVLHSSRHFTATVGLATLQDQHLLDHGLVMAGATAAAVPACVVFLLFQRRFVHGLRAGGVKG